MSDLGKAYVQIIPSAEGISGSISSALGGEATAAGQSAGLNLVGAIKGVIAAAGIGTALKETLDAGADLQQSFGGIDTLYGEAAGAAKAYAAEAAAAGISANDYAEQAVSFGASLRAAFGGDMVQAAEAANTAIMDMADNSAKMGTDITSIQTAYAGFSKQNYTMLDNLKLGYGGTKSEMERLLADAQELSGVEYNIDNLGDVYAAIHVIQEDLGLTGVAADEAASTFSGSLGAMQASATNLMANLALGEDITPALAQLGVSVQNFLLDNLFPMVGNILSALPELLSGLSSTLIGMLNIINNNPEEIVQLGIDIVTGLVTAIVEAAPYLIEAAFNLAFALGEALINTDWASIGSNLISTLKNSISLAAGEILGTDTSIVGTLTSGILSGVSSLITTGGELLMSVVSGLLSALPELILTAGELIIEFSSAILEQLPTILENGVQLILSFVQGITQDSSLAEIGSSVVQVITQFAATILENLPTILEQGILLLGELCAGLIEAIPDLVLTVGELIVNIVDTLSEYDWLTLGKNVVQGIIDGLMGMIDSLVDAVQNLASAIWDEIVDFFDIGSPSKLAEWGGQMIDQGFAGGIKKNAGLVEDAIGDLNENVGAQLMVESNYGEVNPTSVGGQGYTLDDLFTLLNQYLPALAENQNNIVLQGDAEGLFNVVRSQDKIYKRMNGESAFA